LKICVTNGGSFDSAETAENLAASKKLIHRLRGSVLPVRSPRNEAPILRELSCKNAFRYYRKE
jgi:hypothetical protein